MLTIIARVSPNLEKSSYHNGEFAGIVQLELTRAWNITGKVVRDLPILVTTKLPSWRGHGVFMACLWRVYGVFMACLWCVYGVFMACS